MFLTPSEKRKLRQHAVYLDDSLLKKAFGIDPNRQIENILDNELPLFIAQRKAEEWKGPVPVMLWAHGGNVMRSCAIREALDHIDGWMDTGIYPIYFLWDTGPLATAVDAIHELLRPDAADLDRTVHAHEHYYQTPWDKDFDWLAERADVPGIWSEMKDAAHTANQPGGGAYKFIDLLCQRADKLTDKDISLHAVGHSGGAIFHSWFIPDLLEMGFELKSLQLLAPAVRIDRYEEFLASLKGKGPGRDKTLMFTMDQKHERDDDMIRLYKIPVYQQGSILYFIRDVLDTAAPADLLGLQACFQVATSAVQGSLRAVFTPTGDNAKDGEQSNAERHVDFPSDTATLNSIAYNILGAKPKHPFPPANTAAPSKPTVLAEAGEIADDKAAPAPS